MEIKRHLIGTKEIETIQTRETSKVIRVKIENDKSLAELYVAEDENTLEVQKNFLIIQENFRVFYDFNELEYVGSFDIRNGLHTFWVFEIKSEYVKNINAPVKKFENIEINITQPIIKQTVQKWKRLPKPDLNKNFTEYELQDMHPERQLKYILNKKYNLKGRVINKLTIENQINYILTIQNGDFCDPQDLIKSQTINTNIIDDTISEIKEIIVEETTINEIPLPENTINELFEEAIEDSSNESKIKETKSIEYVNSFKSLLNTIYDNGDIILVLANKLDNQLI
jgi:hypothetical protein